MLKKKKKKKKKTGKLNGPSSGAGVLGTIAETGAEMFVKHGIPWMGKKAIEMGRYYGSEALRDPKLQKKAIDYALDKAKPLIQSVGVQALNQQSTKIRPDKKNKTDRPDLDGKGFKKKKKKGTREIEIQKNALDFALEKSLEFCKNPRLTRKGRYPDYDKPGVGGEGVAVHKLIGKPPKPNVGVTLPGHKYTGPYNDLDKQMKFDQKTGKILEIYDPPTGKNGRYSDAT